MQMILWRYERNISQRNFAFRIAGLARGGERFSSQEYPPGGLAADSLSW